MTSYFYITVDEKRTRQYCNLGVTTNPRVRLNQHNMDRNQKYALLVEYKHVEYKLDTLKLLELEKMCLNATIKYYNSDICSIEGRAGDIDDIARACEDIISNWFIKGKYVEYNESDYVINTELKTEDFEFRCFASDNFNKFYTEITIAQLVYDDIFRSAKHIKAIYDFARLQNKYLNITSVQQYLNYVEKNKTLGQLYAVHMKYALNPKEHFSSIWTNWYDYLGVDSSHFIKDKEEWKQFCANHKIYTTEKYNEECKKHKELMPDPAYWFADFGHLNEELPIDANKKNYSNLYAE